MLKNWMVRIYIVLMFLVAFAASKVSMLEAAEGDVEIKILGNNSICRLQDYMRKMIYIQDLEVNFTENGKLSLEWDQVHLENNVELVRGGNSV
ncbi:hypothetical protein SAMN02745111_01711 [Eubacterium uniforme]|uniref:Uncharacterized protein n=1 Tax=Eubacterium uniforme TaxID=39495 RepID=A0A1T4VVH1_9FIRM|nr:hypothetical protein [Eubacterium uniforme]SKA68983.1 hypothetical protein SAMN02745111_01711 [Eubacterium uniforme]